MRCLKLFCLITTLILFSSIQPGHLSSAQAPPAREPQRKQEPAGEKEDTQKPLDYSQEAYVIEQIKNSYRFEKDGTGQYELSFRARVQSEAGVEALGQLVFSYSAANEKLDIENVSVRKQDGKVITATDKNIQDLTSPVSREAPVYTDYRQKHVTVPGLRPGDLLEYRIVRRIITPIAQNNFWFAHEFLKDYWIVLDERLEVNIPQETTVKLKTEPGLDPIIEQRDGRRVYSWKHASLKKKEKDEKDDSESEESKQDKPPQIQMTTFKGWDEVGQWYAALQRDRTIPDDNIRAKVADQTRGHNNDLEKIEELYNYVAKNFRYVSLSFGEGRYQPHAAAEIMALQYGDCKDKHTLLASMLQASGMRAYPVLINSSRKIDPDIPSPAQFDHVISAIPLGKEMLWVDTTAEVAPFRLLARPLRKKQALLIPDDGPARLETTPADPPFLITELVELEAKVDDLGELKGRLHLAMRGDKELIYRVMFRRTSKSNWKDLGKSLTYGIGLEAEVSDVRPGDPGATDKPFEVDSDFTSTGYLDWSSKKATLELPLPNLILPYADPDKKESSKPIELGSPSEINHRLKLALPSRYKLRLPVPVTLTRDYAEYRSSYKLEGATLIVERTLHVRQREIPAARTQDYLAFRSSAQADSEQTVSLESTVAGSPVIPETMKVEDLLRTVDAAIKNNKYPLAEEMLNRVLSKEPKHKFARRLLGSVLYEQHKYDAAINILREQTKLNPFDDYAHFLIGRCLWRQQKYDEAEAAFRKHLEITPLDKWGQGDLGLMLVEWRKYKEAIPELERAISLNPDQESEYQIALGRSYLTLEQREKAAEAFDRAIKLSPEPRTWNDVAYMLTFGKIELDKAQEYAESAVTDAATQLRTADLERLELENLNDVSRLAAYWDTLGWVHFQKGNLDLAEKFLTATWLLGQYGENGDHLGQLYEKRSKKEEAIRWYSLAVFGRHPVPDSRENLARLAGKEKIEALLSKAKEEFNQYTTLKLGSLLKDEKEKLEAEFYIMLVSGGTGNPRIAGVKFIQGAEKMRTLGAKLKEAKFLMTFPDETPTKIIRRGTLSCLPRNGECTFVLIHPDDIISVD